MLNGIDRFSSSGNDGFRSITGRGNRRQDRWTRTIGDTDRVGAHELGAHELGAVGEGREERGGVPSLGEDLVGDAGKREPKGQRQIRLRCFQEESGTNSFPP